MIDKRPASEYMEEARKAIGKLDDFNERHHISGKALSSMIIIVLIIILAGVYMWQRKHPKDTSPAPAAVETQETVETEEIPPAETAEEPAEETEEEPSAEEEGEEPAGEESEEEGDGGETEEEQE